MNRVIATGFVAASFLSGCGVAPKIPYRAVMNEPYSEPLDLNRPTRAGYVGPMNFEEGTYPRRHFVGLALSGGGSRAAVFSAAVMEALENIGLLEEVYAISSVSGGSLTNGYYALNPPDGSPSYWTRSSEILGQNLLTPLAARHALPQNLLATSITTYDRSDLMADVMDKRLFRGATFRELAVTPTRGGAPLVLINSTLSSATRGVSLFSRDFPNLSFAGVAAGEAFTFTRDTLERFGTDTETFRVADAVMASSAFPGAFATRTLGVFRDEAAEGAAPVSRDGGRHFVPPSRKPVSYVHLIDGGASDNLATEAISQSLLGWHQQLFDPTVFDKQDLNQQRGPGAGCAIVLVDSDTGRVTDDSQTADVRSSLDHFVDTNFLEAIDAMMKRRREDTLRRMGIDLARRDFARNRPRLNPHAVLSHVIHSGFRSDGYPAPPPVCLVWHLGLSTIDRIWEAEPYLRWEISDAQLKAAEKLRTDTYRIQLASTARSVETNFKLSSSQCSRAADIRAVLRASARELVLGDKFSREKICEWMEAQGMNSHRCRTFDYVRDELPACAMK